MNFIFVSVTLQLTPDFAKLILQKQFYSIPIKSLIAGMRFFKSLFDYNMPGSFVNRLRKKRFSHIQEKVEALIAEKGQIKILDIGGELDYWKNMGWQNRQCSIYLLNLDTVPQKGPMPGFHYITGNALHLPYAKGEFDLVFSNSVIEHVGSRENQHKFAEEIKRISDCYIIQTPSYWFPLEPHSLIPLFQFIPHKLRAFLIMQFNINYFPKAATYPEAVTVSRSTMMLTKKEFQELFPKDQVAVEYLLGLPKSYTVYKG